MTEHKCLDVDKDDEFYQDIRIIYHDNSGWFLWFDYPNGSNCEIVYCPFCGIRLDELLN